MDKEKVNNNPKSTKYWFEIAEAENEEIEQQREHFVRNVAQTQVGIPADREKYPDGVSTWSYKRLPPNRHEKNR